ncbi:MAG: PilN domain-containing protein [Xanthomonadales bacterium]|nr:PilN domain-containing protein [Xanthomonadales bacterium]
MARINLLPWRAERQKERKKQFFTMLALSAVAGFAVWFAVDYYYDAQISGQQERNAFLDTQIADVKKKITQIEELEQKKSNLLSRKQVIEELQANRSQMVHLFDALVRTIPDGVVLTGLNQEGDKLTLEGRSQSYARVSNYMDNLSASGWMTKPDLSVIQAQDDVSGLPHTFKLTVTLSSPNAQSADGAAAPADGSAPAASQTTLQPLMPAAGQPAAGAAPAGAAPAATGAPATAPAAGAPAPTQQTPPPAGKPSAGGAAP